MYDEFRGISGSIHENRELIQEILDKINILMTDKDREKYQDLLKIRKKEQEEEENEIYKEQERRWASRWDCPIMQVEPAFV